MSIPIGTVVVARQVTERELHSADANTPQVTASARASRPGLRRTRVAAAALLRRAASRVAPA